jgi:hypothetical protein
MDPSISNLRVGAGVESDPGLLEAVFADTDPD